MTDPDDRVERVARALWEFDHDDKPWETRPEATKFKRRVQARAAITALSPDDAVTLDTITNILSYHYDGPVSHDAMAAEEIMNAMRSAALPGKDDNAA